MNVALDALREVRCVARSADRDQIAHGLLFEAVHAYHRRSVMGQRLETQVLRTYSPPLDEQVYMSDYLAIDKMSQKSN